jgi:uncharacterized protein YpmS
MHLLAALAAAGESAKSASGGLDIQGLLQSYATQFGVIVLILACLLIRKFVVPEWVFKRDEEQHAKEISTRDERIAQLESQVQRLQDLIASEMMPALTKATEINAKFVEEMAHRRYASTPHDERG